MVKLDMKVMTKKSKNSSQPNYKANRLFMFLSFLMAIISSFGVIDFVVRIFTVPPSEYSVLVGLFYIIIFLGYLIGVFGIFKPLPPLHYGVIIASAINLVISLIIIISGSGTGLLQGALSFLILYLGLRFPINFGENHEVTFNLTR